MSETNPRPGGRRLRNLRIAWSVLWVILSALMIVLWVRSYWHWDHIAWGVTAQQGFLVTSQSGAIVLTYRDLSGTAGILLKWQVGTQDSPDQALLPIGGMDDTWAGCLFLLGEDAFMLSAPHWFLVPLTFAFAALPWFRWRFSLRTLLIGMTVVAALLGAVVWAIR